MGHLFRSAADDCCLYCPPNTTNEWHLLLVWCVKVLVLESMRSVQKFIQFFAFMYSTLHRFKLTPSSWSRTALPHPLHFQIPFLNLWGVLRHRGGNQDCFGCAHWGHSSRGPWASRKTFGHESGSESLTWSELTVKFFSSFFHRLWVLRLEASLPSRKFKCSSLVHLPFDLDSHLIKSYIFESSKAFKYYI